MVAPIRYTSQKRQERISRRQLCERLDEFGWIATPPDEDLGEDFIVHIYLQGRATGVTFHVQEKSVANLNERRRGDFLVYDFEVKDLKHWEAFSLPVVLMVWDIKLREGRWVIIDDVISDLDQRRPKWRENKSIASVYIPWVNTTDDAGLVKLKQDIGHRLFPIIARDKPLEIQFKQEFPNTDEGKDTIPLTASVSPNPEKAPSPQLLHLIDKLCTIQGKVGRFLRIPDEGLTRKDVRAINELITIIESGRTTTKTKEMIGSFKDHALDLILDIQRQDKRSHLTVSADESWVELLSLEIATGSITQHITGRIELSVTELEKAVAKLNPGEYLPIKFVDVEIIEIFPDWFIREAQRLSQLLVEKFSIEAVYLFGSLVWNDIHAPETDIDLAVSGLPEEQFLEVVSYLERESKSPIDLVDLNKVSEHLRQRILTEGKLLYEREPVAAFG